MIAFQYLAIPICLFFFLRTLVKARSAKRPPRLSLLTAGLWALAALLIGFPSGATKIAELMGIGRGTDLILYLGLLAGLQITLILYARFRRLEVLVAELVRSKAIETAALGQPIENRNDAGSEKENATKAADSRTRTV